MNAIRILALALIIGGALSLGYGGFTYTKNDHEAKFGPIEVNVKEKKTVEFPVWAGIGAIVIGGLLLVGKRK
ncbi:MAG TPA: hypothetical protein VIC31_04150 [Rudaea sp.]|jgi:hypothetical protein